VGVLRLPLCLLELSAQRGDTVFERADGHFAPLVLRRPDQLFIQKLTIAPKVRHGKFVFGTRSAELSIKGIRPQPVIGRIELGDELTGLELIAYVNSASHDLPSHTEADLRFVAGANFAGKRWSGSRVALRDFNDANGPLRVLGRKRLRATAQGNENQRGQSEKRQYRALLCKEGWILLSRTIHKSRDRSV